MAIDTNLLSRYALGSTREDLSDKIYNTDPVETPFMSAIGREKSENIMKEWNVDTLQAATDNVVTAGANFEADALVSATKLNAYHQVSRIDVQVDRRADVVAKPGRRQEIAYQIMKAMKTLKNSVELTILKRKIGVVGNATGANGTGGETAGAPAWIRTNVDIGLLAHVPPTLVSGRPGIAGYTRHEARPIRVLILEAKQSVYDNSMGDPNMLLLSPGLKRSLSGYCSLTPARESLRLHRTSDPSPLRRVRWFRALLCSGTLTSEWLRLCLAVSSKTARPFQKKRSVD